MARYFSELYSGNTSAKLLVDYGGVNYAGNTLSALSSWGLHVHSVLPRKIRGQYALHFIPVLRGAENVGKIAKKPKEYVVRFLRVYPFEFKRRLILSSDRDSAI